MTARYALTLILPLSLLAVPALAADSKDASAGAPGFNELDRDNDGQITRSEAARNPTLAKRFAEADGDKDGRVSRAEYLKVMAAKDFTTLREKAATAIDPDTKVKPEERGFNDLDKDSDGKLSRAEAAGNPKVARKFAESDGDKDGYVSRAEYLKTAAAEDWRNARDSVADFIRPDDKSSSGSSAKSK
jgi:Ca2+-binding EF-hand superfamily protein